MKTRDWNHNGKEDFQDRMIQYQIYQEIMDEKPKKAYTPKVGKGITNFGMLVATIGGLVLATFLLVILGVDTEQVSPVIIVVMWTMCSSVLAFVAELIGL